MGSSRFPGKVLAEVAGRPALAWVVERVRRARLIDDIVLATSIAPADDVLEEWGNAMGLAVHRGSEDDVLQRVVDAQSAVNSEVVVEVTGDCILLDPDLLDVGVRTFVENDCDVVSTTWKTSYPNGINVQVYGLDDLAEVAATIFDPPVREHVSLYFYEHPERYRAIHLFAPRRCHAPELRLSLDYPEDHQLICAVYERLLPRYGEDFGAEEIVRLLREEEPALAQINAHRVQRAPR
jgi:spore coat polysaccharide biosynthesis protein SpsF